MSSSQPHPTRLLLVDDHHLLRQGLIALLHRNSDFKVVAEAADGESAVRLAREVSPDVVLMDVQMPGLGGIEATRRLLADNASLKIIGLTGHAGGDVAAAMLRAGATGHVLKDASVTELAEAVQWAIRGDVYVSKSVLGSFTPTGGHTGKDVKAVRLSPRESEVLRLVADGLSTKQAARQLSVSVKTIETHRRNLMEKLQIDHVAGLTKYAIRQGLSTV